MLIHVKDGFNALPLSRGVALWGGRDFRYPGVPVLATALISSTIDKGWRKRVTPREHRRRAGRQELATAGPLFRLPHRPQVQTGEHHREREEDRRDGVEVGRVGDDIIVDRISAQTGQPLDVEQLEADIGRVYGLQIFKTVDYEIVEEHVFENSPAAQQTKKSK